MIDRTPPSNEEAELAVIGSTLAHGTVALAHAAGLSCDDFYFPAHRVAWKAIVDSSANGSVLDPITVEQEIRKAGANSYFNNGWLTWALEVMSKACPLDLVPHFAQIVSEMSRARQLIFLCTETAARAYGGADWADLIATHRHGIGNLETLGNSSATAHVSTHVKEYMAEIERISMGETIEVISSGIPELDDITGGFQPGQLILVAARPGHGKTAFTFGTLAVNAIRGIPCLGFSLEMLGRELAERLVIWDSKRPKKFFRQADVQAFKAIYPSASVFEKSSLWINDRATGLSGIVGEARKWHAQRVLSKRKPNGDPDRRGLIAIDYAQLVRVKQNKNQNREQVVAAISGSFKQLAKELSVPVILVAQLNRACEKENRPPMMSDLRESGALEQDADIIIFPHSPKPEDPKNFKLPRKAEMIVAKNRGGEIGVTEHSQWVPELMTFREITDAYYEEPKNHKD